jgi:hypothetical protein
MKWFGYLFILGGVAALIASFSDATYEKLADLVGSDVASLESSAQSTFLFLGVLFVLMGVLFVWLEYKFRPTMKIATEMRGGMTLSSGLADAAEKMTAINQTMSDQVARGERTAHLRRDGAEGTARILAVRDTGALVNFDPIVDIDMEVSTGGSAPYQISRREVVSKVALGRIAPGAEIPVMVDPFKPTEVLIDWQRSSV